MDLLDKRVHRNEDVAWRSIDGEALLISPKDSLIYPLNTVGTRIWELLDGENRCRDVIEVIDAEFEGDPLSMREDVRCFLEELLDKGLARSRE